MVPTSCRPLGLHRGYGKPENKGKTPCLASWATRTRVRHGCRSQRHGLVHARLGKRFAAAYGHAGKLRRELERLLAERHGEIPLVEVARVQTVLRLE